MTKREKLLSLKPDSLGSKYEIVYKKGRPQKLGEGGSGIIYKAKQLFSASGNIYEQRAIKFFVYRDDLVKNGGYVSNTSFDTEIYNYTKLNHQNVLKVVDGGYYKANANGTDIDIPYLVNEFFDLPDLDSLFYPENADRCIDILKDEDTIFALFIQIIRGIQYLHHNYFYHCDIAPKNIFLKSDKDGEFHAVIGDIGSGKSVVNATFQTMLVIGTREYMPEDIQAIKGTVITFEKFKSLQPRWDIYSTAKTLRKIIQNIKDSKLFHFDFWNLDLLFEKLNEHTYEKVDEILADLSRLRPISNQIFNLDELSEASKNIGQIIIPIHSAFLSKRMRELSKHDMMLRLMDVTQLLEGATFFPGANHTRYEHALGTYELMREAMLALLRNTEYVKILSEKHVIIGLISALLSSLVYYPYSYIVTEIREQEPELFKELAPRLVFRKLMDVKSDITGKSLMESIHDLFNVYQIDIGSLEYVIFGKNGTSNNELDMLNAILNSSVGVRVIDYSMRDSHHIGLAYEMNLNDLFMSMSIARGEFCLGQSGITSAEQIISNRYWLFKRIYWNNPNRANASLLKHLFFSVCNGQLASELIELIPTATNDNVLQLVLKHSGKQKEAFRQSIKLIQRKGQVHYKCVLALDKASSLPHASYICWRFADLNYSDQHRIRDTIEEELIKYCKLEASITNGGPLILIDMPFEKKGTKLGNDIRVERHDNSYLELSKASGIISGLNQSFQDQLMLVRVYIRPDIFYLCKEKEEHVKMIEFLNKKLYDLL